MAANLPSVLQTSYSENVSAAVASYMLNYVRELQIEARRGIGPTSDQLPPLPDSVAMQWAGETAEKLRKLILAYFKEIGAYPE